MPAVQSNGTTLYYETHGEGQPLLFIHGLGSSTLDWEFQVAAFSSSYRVITFDLRGHGQSVAVSFPALDAKEFGVGAGGTQRRGDALESPAGSFGRCRPSVGRC